LGKTINKPTFLAVDCPML